MNNKNNNPQESLSVKSVHSRYITLDENIFDELNAPELRVYMALRYKSDFGEDSSEIEMTINFLIQKSKVKRSTLFECLKTLERKYFLIRRLNWEKGTFGKTNEYEVAQHLYYFKPLPEVKVENAQEKEPNFTSVHCPNAHINGYINGSYIVGVRVADRVVRVADRVVHQVHTCTENVGFFAHGCTDIKVPYENRSNYPLHSYTCDLNVNNLPKSSDYHNNQTLEDIKTPNPTENKPQKPHIAASQPLTESSFDKFWEIYPAVKKNRKRAQLIWKNKKLDKMADLIMEKLRNQIAHDEQWKDGYMPHATTYLNNERWNDEIARPFTKSTLSKHQPTKPNDAVIYNDFANELKLMKRIKQIPADFKIPDFEEWKSKSITSDANAYVKQLKQ